MAAVGITAGIKALNSGPFWLNTNDPDTTVTLAANESRGPISMSASQRGPLIIGYFGAYLENSCKIRMYRGGTAFQNTDIAMETIFGVGGTNFRMFKLTEPIILDGLDALEVFLSAGGAGATVQLTHQCSRFGFNPTSTDLAPLQSKSGTHQMFYTLDDGTATIPAYTVPGTGTLEKYITISGNHHFQIETKTAFVSNTMFTIDIVDTATGASIFYAPEEKHHELRLASAFGSAAFPMRYAEPITVYAGMKLKVMMTNLTDEDITADLTLGGRAILNGRAV